MSLTALQGHKEIMGDNYIQSYLNQSEALEKLLYIFQVEADLYCRLKDFSEAEYLNNWFTKGFLHVTLKH